MQNTSSFKKELDLEKLLRKVRACTACQAFLPHCTNPIIRAKTTARILIVGQAPGSKVHKTSIPWNDRSGDRLREWLNLDRDIFYDDSKIAIMPMGFCYPGVDKNGGDKPPRRECAPLWHAKIKAHLPEVQITLLVGSYAQRYYLSDKMKDNLNDTVTAFEEYLPHFLPLPHPSWRNTGWLKKNPWFLQKLVPVLQARVKEILKK